MTSKPTEPRECPHLDTQIWEPHLAGARKCLECGMVYNPNYNPPWFFEGPSLDQQLEAAQAEIYKLKIELDHKEFTLQNTFNQWQKAMDDRERLHRVIAKELTENDELGCEFVYVTVLKSEIVSLKGAVKALRTGNCFCEMGIGRPYMDGHTQACTTIRQLLGEL